MFEQKVILASQSPRRRELLHLAEIDFDVLVADTDESYPPGLSFEETAIYIAKNKALAVAAKNVREIPMCSPPISACRIELRALLLSKH